jgi:hypothetical protein
MKTVVALYDEMIDAQAAVNELVRSGFNRSDISLIASNRWEDEPVANDLSATDSDTITSADQLGADVTAGMVTGGALGGLGGVLLGLGALAIPGFGPIIAAGPLVAGLAGAGIGAAVGGLVGALVNWGVPPEEAEIYAESVRRGGILVGLKTDEANADKAIGIMNQFGPIDVERRSDYWRATGWTGFDQSSAAWTPEQMNADEMKYSDYLDYSAYAPAFREHHQATYGDRAEGYIWYDPAYRYGYTLGNDEHYQAYETWDDLENEARAGWAKTEFAAERAWDDVKAAVRFGWEEVKDAFDFEEDFNLFEPGFREHYETQYVSRGHNYDWYAPGYRYGYKLAMDERWDDYDTWDELETEARREWEGTESTAGRAWDDFKDAVRRGWEDVRDALDIEADYGEYEPTFREHYDTTYRRANGRDYAWYEPAYRYGYVAGLDERYDNYATWDDRLEADIRREWEAGEHAADSAWLEIRDAVRRGWESIREALDIDDQMDDDVAIKSPGIGGYTSHR